MHPQAIIGLIRFHETLLAGCLYLMRSHRWRGMHQLPWPETQLKSIAAWEVYCSALMTPPLGSVASSKVPVLTQFCEVVYLALAIFYARRMVPNHRSLILQMNPTVSATGEGDGPRRLCLAVRPTKRNRINRNRNTSSTLCRSSSMLLALLTRLAFINLRLGLAAGFKAMNRRALICSNPRRPGFEAHPCQHPHRPEPPVARESLIFRSPSQPRAVFPPACARVTADSTPFWEARPRAASTAANGP